MSPSSFPRPSRSSLVVAIVAAVVISGGVARALSAGDSGATADAWIQDASSSTDSAELVAKSSSPASEDPTAANSSSTTSTSTTSTSTTSTVPAEVRAGADIPRATREWTGDPFGDGTPVTVTYVAGFESGLPVLEIVDVTAAGLDIVVDGPHLSHDQDGPEAEVEIVIRRGTATAEIDIRVELEDGRLDVRVRHELDDESDDDSDDDHDESDDDHDESDDHDDDSDDDHDESDDDSDDDHDDDHDGSDDD